MIIDNNDDNESWRSGKYSFFTHTDCEMYPCHEIEDKGAFNCLFCYCPLYALGDGCGGDYIYLENGVKDCSPCRIPHERGNYGSIVARLEKIVDKARQR